MKKITVNHIICTLLFMLTILLAYNIYLFQ